MNETLLIKSIHATSTGIQIHLVTEKGWVSVDIQHKKKKERVLPRVLIRDA